MSTRHRDPRGRAHATYRRPCPGCGEPIRPDDEVKRVDFGGEPGRWWHVACRRRVVADLVVEPGPEGP